MPEDNVFGILRSAQQLPEWHGSVHLTVVAVNNCTLCDPLGYRPNGLICDHIDRTEIAAAGLARVRAALRKGAQ